MADILHFAPIDESSSGVKHTLGIEPFVSRQNKRQIYLLSVFHYFTTKPSFSCPLTSHSMALMPSLHKHCADSVTQRSRKSEKWVVYYNKERAISWMWLGWPLWPSGYCEQMSLSPLDTISSPHWWHTYSQFIMWAPMNSEGGNTVNLSQVDRAIKLLISELISVSVLSPQYSWEPHDLWPLPCSLFLFFLKIYFLSRPLASMAFGRDVVNMLTCMKGWKEKRLFLPPVWAAQLLHMRTHRQKYTLIHSLSSLCEEVRTILGNTSSPKTQMPCVLSERATYLTTAG